MSDYPMLISNKLHSFRNFRIQSYQMLKYCQQKLISNLSYEKEENSRKDYQKIITTVFTIDYKNKKWTI